MHMRPLMPVLIATCMALTLPLAAQARGGGSHPHASDITVTKSTDKSSPKLIPSRPKASKKTPEKIEGGSDNIRR
jgi:type VI protein secretion system component Hcp